MSDFPHAFLHIKNVLTVEDVASLKEACRNHLSAEDSIPSYALLGCLDLPAYDKVKRTVERQVGATLHYLNDFYIYTDDSFGTSWHMDTELFTFEHAVNAWILLSPERVSDPLSFIESFNDSPDRYYHSVRIDGDTCTFTNFSNRKKTEHPLAAIEESRLHTPEIDVGDLLILNPRRFHRTNTTENKHSLVIKFVHAGSNGLLSKSPVPALFWPEVGVFSRLVRESRDWDAVLDGIRQELKTPKGRKALSAGFYPEKIDLYKRMAETL